jgi:predicted DNA-binding transcriptional regulator YafY
MKKASTLSPVSPSADPAVAAAQSDHDLHQKVIRKAWDKQTEPSPADKDRMNHIHLALRRARVRGNQALPTATQFARELGLTRQTIYSLINRMIDDHGLPVERKTGGGYYYEEEVIATPFCQLSESEVLAVYLSHEMLRSFPRMPLKRRAQSAFRKIIAQAGLALSFDAERVEEAFSITPSGHPAYYNPQHFEICSRAVLDQEELRINYTKIHGDGAGVPEDWHVKPLHLSFYEFAWYLLAWDYKRRTIRCLKLTRMNSIQRTRVRFERPAKFNARAILRRNFAIYWSGKEEDIALEFSPRVARMVQEHEWHKTQKFTTRADGSVGMTLRVARTPDFIQWVAGYMDDCRIMAPATLRDELIRRQRLAADGHGRGFS